ncbi:MAG: DUF4132 domain-containing protein [Catenulispora sp.]|nr:DUF4132 domain-containing protein [Catenulispora sp.]
MTGAATATVPKSEDVCETPEAMRRLVVPRRGGRVNEPLVNPRAAAYHATWLAEQAGYLAAVVHDPDSEPELVADYASSATGPAEQTPFAAAVDAVAAIVAPEAAKYAEPTAIVDVWVGARGLVFATEAAVELFGLAVSAGFTGTRLGEPHLNRRTGDYALLQHADVKFALAVRLRQHLASASDDDYAMAREVLQNFRADPSPRHRGTVHQRMLTSFLLPEHTDWVDEDLRAFPVNRQDQLVPWLMLCALTTDAQAAAFPANSVGSWCFVQEPRTLWTALDTVGAGVLPIVLTWCGGYTDSDRLQRLLAVAVCVPTDEALQFLVDNLDKKNYTAAVLTAAKNFPRRALRLLADAAQHATPSGLAAVSVLRIHVLANDELARAELPNLGPAARELVEGVLAADVRVPAADPESLPPLFVNPPWVSGAKPPKPVVVTGLTAPAETVMAWRAGEQEAWAAQRTVDYGDWGDDDWPEIARRIASDGAVSWYDTGRFLTRAPEALVRSVLPAWRPDGWEAESWGRVLAARFGPDALPAVLHLARRQPATCSFLLAPFAAPEAALLASEWLGRLKSARPLAMAWLTRHPAVAARTLIPVALGKAGKARDAAALALRALAGTGYADQVTTTAAEYGEAVAKAIAAVLADDGTLHLPKSMPERPDWADPRVLPQVLLKGRQTALPEQSVGHLVLMLAVSNPAEPYAGVQIAQDICDQASLAAFAWALFENWRGAEYPAKENWAFDALRWFGDDETVRRLSPMIRAWPGESAHHRAVAGLDVLAGIGGDTALMHLYGISQKAKFKGLKERAAQRITEIADDLGLTSEQLGDRLVPDLGLDASGTLVLDYGSRRFTVGFDELLKPYVADESGKRLKALPKPGARDDDELAPAAYQRFSGLKKDARTLAADQIARFEKAMVAQRRWTVQEFDDYFVGHPLLRHVARRLVWAVYAEDRLLSSFRVAEDLSLADVSDDEYTLADDAVIGIPHPLHLSGELAAWSDVFADYELLQPFPQLGRAVHRLTAEEKASSNLARFLDVDVPTGKVLGLERRGWRRGDPLDGGVQCWMYRTLPNGGSLTVDLIPGIVAGDVTGLSGMQKFQAVFIAESPDGGDYWPAGKTYPPFSELDDVTASELVRDLTEVTT